MAAVPPLPMTRPSKPPSNPNALMGVSPVGPPPRPGYPFGPPPLGPTGMPQDPLAAAAYAGSLSGNTAPGAAAAIGAYRPVSTLHLML